MNEFPDDHANLPSLEAPSSEPPPRESPSEPTSLHRSTTKKLFGGVAGGMAERFDVDANIVRVVFVVLALVYGLGVAIYLAMWVLIPRGPAGESVPVEEPEDLRRSRWLRYALPVAVLFLAIMVIATFHGAQVVSKGLAILWLVFLVALAVVALGTPRRRLSFRRLLALAFLWCLSALIVLVGGVLLMVQFTGVPMTGGIGVHVWQPFNESAVHRTYRGSIGETKVDLSRLKFTTPRSITVTQGVGQVTVVVPENAVVQLHTDAGVGASQTNVGGAVHVPGENNPVLTLNLRVGVGAIVVSRDYFPNR